MIIENILELINVIDIRTAMAILIWGNFACVLLILAYNRSYNSKNDFILGKYLFWSKLTQAIAFLLLFYRGVMPDILSVNVGNTLLMLGFYLEAISILIILSEEKEKYFHIIKWLFIISVIIFNFIEIISPTAAIRVTVTSVFIFCILVIPCFKLITKRSIGSFKHLMGIFYAIFLTTLIPRAFYTSTHFEATIFSNVIFQSLTFISLVVLMIYSLSAYLLMMKESSDKVISAMAHNDYLTGLWNRYSFINKCEQLFADYQNKKLEFTILFIDIDNFKKINDEYGHSFGDKVLIHISQVIKSSLKESDFSCRYGGEEFAIFLSQSNESDGMDVAHHIMTSINGAVFESEPDFKYTISIGIYSGIPEQSHKLDQFINNADQALYYAKRNGRNLAMEYSKMPSHFTE